MKIINQPLPKIDGMGIATGKPVYTEDLLIPNTLVVKVVRSPHAFARIISINKERAEKVEGLACILTHQDVPSVRFTVAGQSYPEPSPYDRLILDEYVRYVGDAVAIVAGHSETAVLHAVKLLKIEYQILEPVLELEEAENHPSLVHPEDNLSVNFDIGMAPDKNVVCSHSVEFGNVEKELAECDVFLEQTYYTQAQSPAMMETYRAHTYLDHNGRLTILSSTQIPFHVRRIVSRALEMPMSRVRVIKPRIGGGFGGKQTASMEVYPALVTMKTGLPAALIYTRKESFTSATTRHPMRIKVKLGADWEGNIKAVEIENLADSGAYGEHAPTVFWVLGEKTLPLYGKAKAARYLGKAVYTNKPPAGALRGYGATQGTFALESAINELASKLNMDPSLLREKNIIRQGDTHPGLCGSKEGHPAVLESSTLEKCIIRGKELIGWQDNYPRKVISPTKVRGLGMAITMQGSGIAGIDTASAIIKLNDDGFYSLLIGATDMGTGCDTILLQMAAEVLETTPDSVLVHAADTDISPYDTGSYASSTTYVTGNAVVKAAQDLRRKIIKEGASFLNSTIDEVDFEGSLVRIRGTDTTISLGEIAQRIAGGQVKTELIGTGTFGGEKSPPPFIAGFAEVEVDIETGKTELIRYVAVVDCGTVINPNLARIQTEGGLVMGIGMAIYEDVFYNKRGRLCTDSFMQYKIPCRKDICKDITVAFEPSYEPSGPFGAKSLGEIVINTPAPAIAHALFNAIGVSIRDLPITPEKVLHNLHSKERE